jgi:hypothetical protein
LLTVEGTGGASGGGAAVFVVIWYAAGGAPADAHALSSNTVPARRA